MSCLLAVFIVGPMAFVGSGWSAFMAFFSVFSSFYKKTPLETWVKNSTWGTNTKGWSLDKELLEYNKIMRKPQVVFSNEGDNYNRSLYAQKQADNPLYKQPLVITLPSMDKYEEFDMAITTYPYINGTKEIGYGDGPSRW